MHSHTVSSWVFLGIFFALLALAGFVIWPYAGAVFVGALIAYFIYPAYKYLSIALHSGRVAAGLLSIVSVLVIGGIVMILVPSFISQATLVYTSAGPYMNEQIEVLRSCSASSDSFFCREAGRVLGPILSENLHERGIDVIKQTAVFLAQNTGKIVGGVVSAGASIVVVLFSIFYFLDQGLALKNTFFHFLPLKDRDEEEIYQYFKKAVDAVVVGNIGMSALQGLAGGIIFFALGLPASVFWGFVMGIAAFIPAVGPALIFIPAAIILAVSGSYVKAIVLVAISFLVLGAIDNVLKPKIIGDRIKLSSFVIFLGVIGGLATMGMIGMFVGPLVFALVHVFARIYKRVPLQNIS